MGEFSRKYGGFSFKKNILFFYKRKTLAETALYYNGLSPLEVLMGEAKNFHGMARARFRGLNKVEIQFLLTTDVLDLKKMVKMINNEVI